MTNNKMLFEMTMLNNYYVTRQMSYENIFGVLLQQYTIM